MKKQLLLSISLLLSFSFFSCEDSLSQKNNPIKMPYKTERVIVLVVDGPRYSETWGDATHQYIPHMAQDMAPTGLVATNFTNDGYTYTSSGHTAICTGVRQELENTLGLDLPNQPSFFQYYLKQSGYPASKASIITSKDKLFILGNCTNPKWKDTYNPLTDCGKNGPKSGYREDTATFNKVMSALKTQQPNLLLVNFKEPDGAGHANNWPNYIKGIVETDSLVWEVWKFIQTDAYYKDKTTLFVTNDHGRHLDDWKDGFVSHGDECEGCRHINLYAFGPDIKANQILDTYYTQVDLTATIAALLGFQMPYGQGKVMDKLWK
jgi:hypothetical protein